MDFARCIPLVGSVVVIAVYFIYYSQQEYMNALFTNTNRNNITVPSSRMTKHGISNIYSPRISKTGSSTMYNMICRYALQHRLRVAFFEHLPAYTTNHSIFKWLRPNFTIGKSEKYNIVIEHNIYEEKDVERLVKQPTGHIVFVRHPLNYYPSLFNDHKVWNDLNMTKENMTLFLQNVLYNPEWMRNNSERFVRFHNLQSAFLNIKAPEDIDGRLETLKKKFTFGITDYYSLSIVLIRRALKWPMRSMLIFKQNAKKYNRENIKNITLYKELCKWASLDCMLYESVNQTFWRIISQEKNIHQEAAYYSRANLLVEHYCGGTVSCLVDRVRRFLKQPNAIPSLLINGSIYSQQMEVTPLDCALMRVDYFSMTNFIYYFQNQDVDCNKIKECFRRTMPDKPLNCTKICQFTRDTKTMLQNFVQAENVLE